MSTLLRSECLQCLTKQQFRSFPEDAKEEQKLVFLQRMYGILSEASGDVCAPVLVRDINELSREIFGCVHDYSEEKTYYNQLLLEKEQMIREKIQGTEDPLLKALQEFALDFERKVKSGHILAGEKMTYSEFIQKWLKDYARVQMKPTSVERCEISLNRQILPALGYLKVADIKPLHIQDLYTDLQEGGVYPGWEAVQL